jgi:ABC-type transporter Mla subunit MlaD
MDQFVSRLEAEVPLFSQHINTGMSAFTQAAAMSVEFTIKDEDLGQIKDNLASVRSFIETTHTVAGQLAAFQQTVANLPRMTAVLNRSKRALVTVIQRLIDELHRAQVMAREAEASFALIIEQH